MKKPFFGKEEGFVGSEDYFLFSSSMISTSASGMSDGFCEAEGPALA
jgi:hypothetical protein